jgi:hypothetical protein
LILVSTLRTNNQQAVRQEPRSDEDLIQTVLQLTHEHKSIRLWETYNES